MSEKKSSSFAATYGAVAFPLIFFLIIGTIVQVMQMRYQHAEKPLATNIISQHQIAPNRMVTVSTDAGKKVTEDVTNNDDGTITINFKSE